MKTSADTIIAADDSSPYYKGYHAAEDIELARRRAAIEANAPLDAPSGDALPSALHSPYVRKQLEELKVHRPYFLWLVTAIQVVMLIVELVLNQQKTGQLIQTNPFNPMIGPAPGIIIQTGARFTPCIRPHTGMDTPGALFQCPDGVTGGTPQKQSDGTTIYTCTLDQICGMGGLNGQPPNQWYRFIVPVFLHGGVVHLIFNLGFQCRTGFQMEQDFGWWRMALIYIISGVGGFIFGGNYAGLSPSVGCSGALFGLIACLLIDLLQNWRLVKNPGWELAKLIFLIIFSFLLGTLPYLDNFAHIGGFFCGFLAGLIFMPTIYYTKTDKIVKITLQVIAVPLLITVYALMITGFYNASNNCPWCKYLTCIPGMPWCESKWNSTMIPS
ncbi:rhomboid family-domain-containing protein [Chytriomyces sp. MP71]|nr:rhomboid family-domain-containing protein [Chytriomyces sp. MP71]